jgi:phosphonate transport system substrate-binding protein
VLVAAWLLAQMVDARPLIVGSIHHNDPVHEIEKFWPFVAYLAKQLEADGIDQGKVVVAQSIPQMATWCREGKVDLYLDSPLAAMAVSCLSGSKFLLRRWKKGLSNYHTVIFVDKESGIHRLEDLRGRTIAFDDPYSSLSYLLPKMVLAQAGYTLVPKSQPSEAVLPDEVGYVFSGSDANTMVWVLRGKVLVGAMDSQSYQQEARHHRQRLRILHTTLALPRHIVSARADLSPPLVRRIVEVLTTMAQSAPGRNALQAFQNTTQFDPIPAHALAPLLQTRPFLAAEFGERACNALSNSN